MQLAALSESPGREKCSVKRPGVEKTSVLRWIVAFGLAVALGWQWFPNRPEYFLESDSGVWVHIARRMLQGAKPYIDVWDHKPPAILWIHVAALGAAGGQLWCIWLASIASIASGLWISGRLASARFGGAAAGWLAMVWAWVCSAAWLDHVDYTEVFALPLQAVLLWLALRKGDEQRLGQWGGFLAGALTACAILLRPNLAGTGLIVLAFAGPRVWVSAALGGASVFSTTLLAAWVGGWLDGLIDAAWRFNLSYSQWTYGSRWMIAIGIIFGLVARFAGVAALIGFWQARKQRGAWLLAAVASTEFVFALTGGKGFGHYFMPVAVPLSILGGAAWGWASGVRVRRFALCGLALVSFCFAAQSPLLEGAQARARRMDVTEARAAREVRRLSNPEDRVLTWDGHHWAMSLCERREVTRCFHWVMLYVRRGWDQDLIGKLEAAFKAGEVDFVSEGNREHNPFPPIPRADRRRPSYDPALDRLADWIEDHFEVVARGQDYRVWRRRTH